MAKRAAEELVSVKARLEMAKRQAELALQQISASEPRQTSIPVLENLARDLEKMATSVRSTTDHIAAPRIH
jgi:hypothetical protein